MKKSMKLIALSTLSVLVISGIGISALATSDDSSNAAAKTSPAQTAAANNDTAADQASRPAKGDHKGKFKSGHVNVLSVAATVLGKTEAKIKEDVKDSYVGALLTAAGKVEEFKTAYLEAAKISLDKAVTEGILTQAEADTKYDEAEAKMASYDGTTHLCGKTDHSKLFELRGDQSQSDPETSAAAA